MTPKQKKLLSKFIEQWDKLHPGEQMSLIEQTTRDEFESLLSLERLIDTERHNVAKRISSK